MTLEENRVFQGVP